MRIPLHKHANSPQEAKYKTHHMLTLIIKLRAEWQYLVCAERYIVIPLSILWYQASYITCVPKATVIEKASDIVIPLSAHRYIVIPLSAHRDIVIPLSAHTNMEYAWMSDLVACYTKATVLEKA